MKNERSNKKALNEALDIYRDEMRPFIVRCLKRVQGKRVEDCIKTVLRSNEQRYNKFTDDLSLGTDPEEAIDINDFPQIVKVYWKDVFGGALRSRNSLKDDLYRIADVRNKVSHPGKQDVELEFALEHLSLISKALISINQPSGSNAVLAIKSAIEPFRTPAHKLRQGGRDVYAFTLDLETLNNLLPDRVDDAVVKAANRQLTPSHAKKIQEYLEKEPDWLLGPLLLGISPDAIHFHSYQDGTDAVGELIISRGDMAKMKMFDGQHRRRAIKDVLGSLAQSKRYYQRLAWLQEASLPIMLYVENDIEKLRQMFADAAQTKPIEANAVVRFDLRQAMNNAALWIQENSDLFSGRVEMERPSVSVGSQKIIAINQLAAALKAADIGYKGRVSKERNAEYMLDLDSLYDRCLTWSDDFMPTARDEYNALMGGEIDDSEIPQKRTETMAYNATVIRMLAGCFYEWTKVGDDWDSLAEFLQAEALKPGVQNDTLLVDAGLVAPGGTSPSSPARLVQDAIDFIVQRAEEAMGSFGATRPDGSMRKLTPRLLRKAMYEQASSRVIAEYERLQKYRDSAPKSGTDWQDRNAAITTFLNHWWDGKGPFQPEGSFHGHSARRQEEVHVRSPHSLDQTAR